MLARTRPTVISEQTTPKGEMRAVHGRKKGKKQVDLLILGKEFRRLTLGRTTAKALLEVLQELLKAS